MGKFKKMLQKKGKEIVAIATAGIFLISPTPSFSTLRNSNQSPFKKYTTLAEHSTQLISTRALFELLDAKTKQDIKYAISQISDTKVRVVLESLYEKFAKTEDLQTLKIMCLACIEPLIEINSPTQYRNFESSSLAQQFNETVVANLTCTLNTMMLTPIILRMIKKCKTMKDICNLAAIIQRNEDKMHLKYGNQNIEQLKRKIVSLAFRMFVIGSLQTFKTTLNAIYQGKKEAIELMPRGTKKQMLQKAILLENIIGEVDEYIEKCEEMLSEFNHGHVSTEQIIATARQITKNIISILRRCDEKAIKNMW